MWATGPCNVRAPPPPQGDAYLAPGVGANGPHGWRNTLCLAPKSAMGEERWFNVYGACWGVSPPAVLAVASVALLGWGLLPVGGMRIAGGRAHARGLICARSRSLN